MQKVGTLQMGVALSVARFNRGGFDQSLTREFFSSDSSRVNTPVTLANCPFTLEIIICLTLNSATECAGSMFQVVVEICRVASVLIVFCPFYFFLDAFT